MYDANIDENKKKKKLVWASMDCPQKETRLKTYRNLSDTPFPTRLEMIRGLLHSNLIQGLIRKSQDVAELDLFRKGTNFLDLGADLVQLITRRKSLIRLHQM